MFRDESSKVIQKAHAQWGSSSSPTDASESSASNSSPTWADDSSGSISDSPSLASPLSSRNVAPARIPNKIGLNVEQQGMQFYINRYLMNHPDSPRTRDEVAAYFSDADAAQNVMIAVGLAGMSNLLGNKNMNLLARSKYVTALKQTGQLIASNNPAGLIARLRSVVSLALFEVVQGRGPRVTVGSANTHINGAVAVLRSVLPLPQAPNKGAHGVLQLLFSMFIPYQMTDTPLSPGFFETLKFCKQLLDGLPESCSVDLALAIARLIQLLAIADHTVLTDEHYITNDLIRQFLTLDDVFDNLETPLSRAFPFAEHQGEYPAAAVFRKKYHTYGDTWGSRIWNHYRWARILANQRLVQFVTEYPISSKQNIPTARKTRCYTTIERLAEDILTSAPSHWHHPMLDPESTRNFEARGMGNSGAVGLPSLLWHLMVAGCAPNVPLEFWSWAHNALQVIWKQMGMQHALALSEMMEEHRTKLNKEASMQVGIQA
ncbi:uncharacterized protein GGS25DRAFT_475557 [Hypoxylon fragiforme]|uniref:uncharacterized protein n=1 Tax=Hypoxylon fragiforme TaxID=63214 RepID=UPI0020C6758C|nr:uncharacterized protein GGS25DRAFT_475557 [Hypoxylon fragiforme]KAI2612486.1 hypothetical protein GGS25DRAFT_475557 [Hypoxylon fragiforme]